MSASCCGNDTQKKVKPLTAPDSEHNHGEGHSDDDGHDHDHGDASSFKTYIPAIVSLVLLLLGILFDNYFKLEFFTGIPRVIWYTLAYLPVGLPVLREAWAAILKTDFFNEFSLMSAATLGAFAIGEYPEGVAVMLFYAVGELFQNAAVNRAKGNIKALLDVRPNTVDVFRNNVYETVAPETVAIGQKIQVRVGEKAA